MPWPGVPWPQRVLDGCRVLVGVAVWVALFVVSLILIVAAARAFWLVLRRLWLS